MSRTYPINWMYVQSDIFQPQWHYEKQGEDKIDVEVQQSLLEIERNSRREANVWPRLWITPHPKHQCKDGYRSHLTYSGSIFRFGNDRVQHVPPATIRVIHRQWLFHRAKQDSQGGSHSRKRAPVARIHRHVISCTVPGR